MLKLLHDNLPQLPITSSSDMVERPRDGNLSKSAFFEGVGHFERKFQTEWDVAHQPLLRQKTRVIAISCAIKITAVHCLVLPQTTGVTDRRTDTEFHQLIPR